MVPTAFLALTTCRVAKRQYGPEEHSECYQAGARRILAVLLGTVDRGEAQQIFDSHGADLYLRLILRELRRGK